MIHIFSKESDLSTSNTSSSNSRGEPDLIFGFYPVHLPRWASPWRPLVQTMIFDVFVLQRCIVANVAGMISAGMYPYLATYLESWILLPAPVDREFASTTRLNNPEENNNSNNNNTATNIDNQRNEVIEEEIAHPVLPTTPEDSVARRRRRSNHTMRLSNPLNNNSGNERTAEMSEGEESLGYHNDDDSLESWGESSEDEDYFTVEDPTTNDQHH